MNLAFQPANSSHFGTRPLSAPRTLPIPRSLGALCVSAFNHSSFFSRHSFTLSLEGLSPIEVEEPASSRLPAEPLEALNGFSLFPFNFELSTVNLFQATPFPATLASLPQTAENATTLSPAFATLTNHVNHKPFVCHSYKKTPGVGYPPLPLWRKYEIR